MASIASFLWNTIASPTAHAVYKETADAAASSSTAYKIAAGDAFSGSITRGDADWIEVGLTAGKGYQFDLTGTIGWAALEVRDADGALVDIDTNNHDSNFEAASVAFAAPKTGAYYVRVGGQNNWTGNYTLKLKEATLTTFTNDQVAKQLTDGYWESEGFHHFSFAVKAGGTLTVNITGLTAEGQQLAHWALDAWTAASGLKFQYVTGAAQIKFDDNQAGAFGGASAVMANGTALSSFVNVSTQWLRDYGATRDSYTMSAYVHEIGHALGLGHAGNYDGDATWGRDNLYANDSTQISVMSYFDVLQNPWAAGTYAVAITPMIADIIAIRNIYGTAATNAGDTTYNLKSFYAGEPVAMTIVDTGGTDTLDMSWATTAIKIDLNPEAFSNIAGGVGNLSIARGTIIENVIGGKGDDVLIGNSANNRLDGGAGADKLIGGAGDDTYLLGADTGDTITDSSGVDTITSTIARSLSTYKSIENLTLIGNGDINGAGNDLDNVLFGNSGKNTLSGGLGNDTLDGGAGADTLDGGAGNDTYVLGAESDNIIDVAGTDTIISTVGRSLAGYAMIENLTLTGMGSINGTGNALNNVIIGNAADNVLDGGAGNDSLTGGAGNDKLVGGLGKDVLTGGAGADSFLFHTALNASTNVDEISDFVVVDDTIILENAIFTAFTKVGAIMAGAFVTNTDGLAKDADDFLIYEVDTGNLFYDSNGKASGGATLFAHLNANLALTYKDFLIV